MMLIEERVYEQVERALAASASVACRKALIALRMGCEKMPEISTQKIGPRAGTSIVWPKGLEQMLGISAPTRWRWEKDGKLPQRDINVGGRSGWSHKILNAAGLITK